MSAEQAEAPSRERRRSHPTREERAEQLTSNGTRAGARRRRMLVIANPYASTVSERLKNLVVYALQGRYDVLSVETEARDHATEISREAARERYDVVAAFGGDGTINEAANGLIRSDTALAVIPGGSTNVFCRTLGVPDDVVDATERLLGLADRFEPRRIDTGRVNGRHFLFSSGVGIDADVVGYVDRHPRRKASMREWYFGWAAVSRYGRAVLSPPPALRVEAAGRAMEGVTVVVQNSDPYSFFGDRPIRVCGGAELRSGTLSLAVLRRARALDFLTLAPRLLSGRAESVGRHRHLQTAQEVSRAEVSPLGGRALSLHVDGDNLGECDGALYEAAPASLPIVA